MGFSDQTATRCSRSPRNPRAVDSIGPHLAEVEFVKNFKPSGKEFFFSNTSVLEPPIGTGPDTMN